MGGDRVMVCLHSRAFGGFGRFFLRLVGLIGWSIYH